MSNVFLSKLQRGQQSTRLAKLSRVRPTANISPAYSNLLNSFSFSIDFNSQGDKYVLLFDSAFYSLLFSQGQLFLLGNLIDPSSFRKIVFGRISPSTLPLHSFCFLAFAILNSNQKTDSFRFYRGFSYQVGKESKGNRSAQQLINIYSAQLSAQACFTETMLDWHEYFRCTLMVLQQTISPIIILTLADCHSHLHQFLSITHNYPRVLKISMIYTQLCLGDSTVTTSRLLVTHFEIYIISLLLQSSSVVLYQLMGECQSTCDFDSFRLEPRVPMEQSVRIEYNGQKFIIPDKLSFEKQATFAKVQQAARAFCQKNDISLFYTPLLTRIIAYRNEFIFQQIWKKIPPNDREEFLEDLNSIEHDLMDSFYYHFVKKILKEQYITVKNLKISIPRLTKESEISLKEKQELKSIGEHLLKENRVAAILMCAGSSSRFDGEDKFLYPIKLSSKTTILDLMFKRIRKNTNNKTNMPILINCNQQNIEKIQNYLKKKQYYGFSPHKIRYFITYTLAMMDRNGKYCLNDRMKLMKRPSGTASCVQYLLNQNINSFLMAQGVQYVYVSGMENLLQNPCDPILLGIMLTEKLKIGAKCVNQMFYTQKLPRYIFNQTNQKIEVLNTQDIDKVEPRQLLKQLPIAINSMAFQLSSLVKIITDYNHNLFLAEKYHVIQKEEQVYNFRFFKSEPSECYSFQKDLRDVISCVKDAFLYKVSRKDEYAPIVTKNKGYALSQAQTFYKQRLEGELGWL